MIVFKWELSWSPKLGAGMTLAKGIKFSIKKFSFSFYTFIRVIYIFQLCSWFETHGSFILFSHVQLRKYNLAHSDYNPMTVYL